MPLCPLPTGTSHKKRCKPCSARSLPHATRMPPVSRISLQMAASTTGTASRTSR